MFHKLLQRQLKKHFGAFHEIPKTLLPLLHDISYAYDHLEKDRNVIEHALEVSSNEMTELVNTLRNETLELKKAHHELDTLFRNIEEVSFSIDIKNRRVIQMSDACQKVYGYFPEQFVNNINLWREVIHPDDLPIIKDHDKELAEGKAVRNEYRIIHKDQRIRWVETKVIPTINSKGELVRIDGIANDITDRKHAEIQLHQSEERYRTIVETAQEGIWLVDEDYLTIFVNKKLCEMLGYEPEEMIGRPNTDFMDEVGKTWVMRTREKRRQGHYENQTLDLRFVTKNGKYLWASLSTAAILDKDGQYRGGLAMVTDIMERKKSEGKAVELIEQLQGKNKELRQFTYILSHNLRAPVVRILGLANLFKESPQQTDFLEHIVNEVTNLDTVVKDINAIIAARDADSEKREYIDFEQEVELVKKGLQEAIDESKASITTDFHESSGMITVRSFFYNISYHLLSNALKYRLPEVPLHIHLQTSVNERYLCFSIKDNGLGIDLTQHGEKLFGLYKRFHRGPYPGKGIGLILVKTQAETLGGKIEVESKVNEGSTFKVFLPRSDK